MGRADGNEVGESRRTMHEMSEDPHASVLVSGSLLRVHLKVRRTDRNGRKDTETR